MWHYAGYCVFMLMSGLVIAGLLRATSRARRYRSALAARGFVEAPQSQIFADVKAIVRSFRHNVNSSLPPSVERGYSSLGETVVFEMSWNDDIEGFLNLSVVGFRVDPALPDFRASHTRTIYLGDSSGRPAIGDACVSQSAAGAGAHASSVLPNATERPITLEGPRPAHAHYIYGADNAGVRAILTAAFIEATSDDRFHSLGVHKTGEWLFVYPDRGVLAVAPKSYPQWIEHVATLVQKLDLHSAMQNQPAQQLHPAL